MKERLSVAYVQAIAARAGYKLVGENGNEYGVDGYLQRVRRLKSGKFKETGPLLQIQIKATSRSQVIGQQVVYDMDVEAFNKLVDVADDDPPTILVLFRMPAEDDQHSWLDLDDDQLVLRHCCYWHHLKDSPSPNNSSKRVTIPSEQKLTPEDIPKIFDFVKGVTTDVSTSN